MPQISDCQTYGWYEIEEGALQYFASKELRGKLQRQIVVAIARLLDMVEVRVEARVPARGTESRETLVGDRGS